MSATLATSFRNASNFTIPCIYHNDSKLYNGTTTVAFSQSAFQRIFMPTFIVCIVVFGVTLNGVGVVDFFRSHVPKTPFNINIVHLLSLNIVLVLTQQVMNSIGVFYPGRRGWLLGNRACDLYLFCNTMLNALIVNSHGLLALNRTWAIMHPFSYRSHNTNKLSVQLIAWLWIYILLMELPLWLMDLITYRKPVETNGCIINSLAQPVYNTVVVLFISTLPVLAVWVAYIVVIVYKIQRRKVLRVRPFDNSASGTLQHAAGAGENVGSGSAIGTGQRLAKKRQSRSFVIMTLLTVGVTVCYGPRTVLNALRSFTNISTTSDVQQNTALLISCQVVVDPVLLMLTPKFLQRGSRS
ncbi:hypothetical protein BV898_16370 [Hypsibius exemplaris]|uniref:G-protein coupled receptors family 1 profile domain-containing protein n=1 Tax=Hypsibius exemplaris TaxID=2072580 RepID=A0A9X6NLU4_HYPEX|nr:hypothetical protein BV898_16370 [Hypsibius exemplaris]